jgi:hypothetical protein
MKGSLLPTNVWSNRYRIAIKWLIENHENIYVFEAVRHGCWFPSHFANVKELLHKREHFDHADGFSLVHTQ